MAEVQRVFGEISGGPRMGASKLAFAGHGHSGGRTPGHPAHGPATVHELDGLVKQFQGHPSGPAEARGRAPETPDDGKGVCF
jgi:hypothetical protein